MSAFHSKIVREKIEQWKPCAPIDAASIELAERTMGFPLPPQLRELYERCGNGYFAGMRPLLLPSDLIHPPPNPFTDPCTSPRSMVSMDMLIKMSCELEPDDDVMPWPPSLLYFFQWGCGLESCIDRADASLRIVRFDPYFEDSPPTLTELSNGFTAAFGEDEIPARYRYCFQLESMSLEEWLEVSFEGHSGSTLQGMGPQRARWHRRPA